MISTAEIPVGPDGLKTIDDAVCTVCGCVCDDITLKVEDRRIIEARNACILGKSWFFSQQSDDRSACTIEGRPATIDEGVDRAARILVAAKYPLLYGLSDTTGEAQRVAVSIMDWVGGIVDTTTSVRHGPIGVTFQGVGEVTCTLGEIRNRGDLIIFWGSNPAESQPRHFTKYSLTPVGQFLPRGRKDRYAVVVDVRRTKTADACDEFIGIKPGGDFEALWTLRALAKGIELDAAQVVEETGVALAVWQALMDRMKSAKFGCLLFGIGLTMTRGRNLNTEALLALTRDMNAYTRFIAKPMRGQGNVTGADNVVTWRTGYPFGVNHARGYPRFNPGEYTTNEVLSRREADAAMLVGGAPLDDLSQSARDHLQTIPCITLDRMETPASQRATVAFRTATYGINVPGTVYRMDDVPLPLRPAYVSPYPADLEILEKIERRVLELNSALRLLQATHASTQFVQLEMPP